MICLAMLHSKVFEAFCGQKPLYTRLNRLIEMYSLCKILSEIDEVIDFCVCVFLNLESIFFF